MRSTFEEEREAVSQRAMKNGRCRMHGGKATGAPKGNRNAWKHGNYSASESARRAAIKILSVSGWIILLPDWIAERASA